MRVHSKIAAVALAATLALGTFSNTAFAKDTAQTETVEDNTTVTPRAAWTKTISPGVNTVIYTGTGAAQTIGITPSRKPVFLTITMTDYSGRTVYSQLFVGSGRSTWDIGANVKTVYLQGDPCTVSIDTSLPAPYPIG